MPETQMEAHDALMALVQTTWDANTPSDTPLFYENREEERPQDLTLFGRVAIKHNFGTRVTLGPNGTFRRSATLYVQIFVKQGSGIYQIRVLSDAIAHMLEEIPASVGVRMADVDINELGSNDAIYYQINVAADFSYDRKS